MGGSGKLRVESREQPQAKPDDRDPRAGWVERFKVMTGNGDNKLLDPETPTKFDEEEWEW